MIEATQKDGIAILTMRHGKANALDIEFCDALAAQFVSLKTSDACAVVLAGQGAIFSAGVDLVRLSAGGADYIRKFLPALHRLYDAAFFFPKPLVAAVNGHAVAGGCVLAACADYRVMGRGGGRIGITELLVGVPFPSLAFEIMRAVTTHRYFSDTVLSGATFPPDEALPRGLIDAIVPPEGILPAAIEAATRLAALSPQAFALTKRQIRQPVTERLARDGAATEAAVTDIWTQPETLARIRDYVSRTLKKS